MFYHGVINTCRGYRYSMGAALLDKENPERVLYRSKPYLLAPAAPYELMGDVPDVVFPCASIQDGDRVAIYYGAADTCVGLAFGHISEIINHLKEKPPLTITTMRNLLRSLAAAVIPASSILQLAAATLPGGKEPADYVNPFIGTTNFGTTNPGAVTPNGLMSVAPFNVMGSELNRYDKDSRWWSTPYDNTNSFLTGFSHVNLSGVGCPEMGSLLLMPTSGKLNVDYHGYGTAYSDEKASPGHYAVRLDKYGIQAEATATKRVGVSRFTFPAGEANVLLNLRRGADQRDRRDREARVGDRV